MNSAALPTADAHSVAELCQPLPVKKERLLSLDVFRGLTLMGMVLVNSPGDPGARYEAVAHVSWHGWAFADLVFALFLGTLSMFLGSVWNLFFPINQILWTSSLVLFMGGMAMVILASCYYVADVRKIVWWTPAFLVFGVNSLAVWIGSVTLKQTLEKIKLVGDDGTWISLKTFLFNGLSQWLGALNGSLAFAILYVLFWLGIMTFFYRKGILLKV